MAINPKIYLQLLTNINNSRSLPGLLRQAKQIMVQEDQENEKRKNEAEVQFAGMATAKKNKKNKISLAGEKTT